MRTRREILLIALVVLAGCSSSSSRDNSETAISAKQVVLQTPGMT